MRRAFSQKIAVLITVVCASAGTLFGLGERGSPIRESMLYISPDANSAKLGRAGRGRELVILDSTPEWLHIEALLSDPQRESQYAVNEDEDEGKTITGWIRSKNVVRASTPDGDKILYGEAVDSEDQASQTRGRRGAAQDAMRLYYRVADLFPNSPLAAEAMYRSADIRWQMDRAEVLSKPAAREQDAYLRGEIEDHWMKEVMKKFPNTKWSDKAAFHLIDNKLCGNWQAASKCPLKEAEIYEKYAAEHPQSPSTPEALYDAAWRWAALIEIYKTEGQPKKSDEAKVKALALAQQTASQFPQSDWGARAVKLGYLLQQGMPAYGTIDD